ncbi:hypothetical protein L7F22_000364 [Adiantum nelumboides]|nr:hypothetical protein [Adiantum nelumboides]
MLPAQLDSSMEPLMIDDCTKPVTWIDADADYLVTASEDGCVRIYQHNTAAAQDSGVGDTQASPTDLVAVLTRVTLSARCAALERAVSPGKTPRVAVCSDELVVKVIDSGDLKRVQLLTGHTRPVRAAAWCPTQPLLVTCSSDGSARIWDLSTTEPDCVKVLDGLVSTHAAADSELASQAVWHPSGQYFVVAGKANDLVLISAPSWQKAGAFVAEGPDAPRGAITALAFCPNGRYLASATTDGQVMVWEAATRRALHSRKADGLVTGISWSPGHDALAWVDNSGQLVRWQNVVGSTFPSPYEHVEHAKFTANKARGSKAHTDDIDDLFRGTDIDDDDDLMDVEGDGRAKATSPDVVDEEDEQSLYHRRRSALPSATTRAQPAFQPCSTPMKNKRRFLCFNMIGSLVANDQGSHQSISFESHDAGARRNWRFVDHFGYSMVSMGEAGALFASPSQKNRSSEEDDDDVRDHPSTVYFKPFEATGAWAVAGGEWTVSLPRGEEAVAVAMAGRAGSRSSSDDCPTAIVATSSGYLRFFSGSGLQRYIWALGGQVVALAAGKSLALIVHRIAATMDGFQNLSFSLIDLATFAVRQEGTIPLAKGATLAWAGFNSLDAPALYDSTGKLFVLDRAFGAMGQARWVPCLDTDLIKSSKTSAADEAEGEENIDEAVKPKLRFWPVGLTTTHMMSVMMRGSQPYPDANASSRPLIQEIDLAMPVVGQDTPVTALEEEHLRSVMLAQSIRDARMARRLQGRNEDLGDEDETLAEPRTLDHTADKALLQLIQHACKSDRHARALDATRELHGSRMLDAALQIAAFFHLASLADRMDELRAWVSTRAQRDETRAYGLLPPTAVTEEVVTVPRILASSSQEPASADQRSREAKAALSRPFESSWRKSFGRGSLSLQEHGQTSSASSTPTPEKTKVSQMTNEDGSSSRKRRAESQENDEDEEQGEQEHEGGAGHAVLRESEAKRNKSRHSDLVDPFTSSSSSSAAKKTNPFAATRGMTRDRSMHKSSSFFERVDKAATQQSAGAKAGKGKQTTLMGFKKPSLTPAFAESQSQSQSQSPDRELDGESQNKDLEMAQLSDQQSLVQLEETQNDDEETQMF